MEIAKYLQEDHAKLRSLSQDIMGAWGGGDIGGRDNQFDLYDLQIRRHLAVIEEVLLAPLKKDPQAQDSCIDILARHKSLRAALAALDRPDKTSREWTNDFSHFTEMFETLCSRHEALLRHAERVSDNLGEQYERAKLRRMRGGWHWNYGAPASTAATVAGIAGIAALAGATYAANRYFQSNGHANGRLRTASGLGLDSDETTHLISSAKVEHTPVVDREGTKIGMVTHFMVDKYSGQVAYAVLRFGGIMGFGASLFPLPWMALDYDEKAGGYRIGIGKKELAKAPRFAISDEPDFDTEYRSAILDYYRPLVTGKRAHAFTAQGWDGHSSDAPAQKASARSHAKPAKRKSVRSQPVMTAHP